MVKRKEKTFKQEFDEYVRELNRLLKKHKNQVPEYVGKSFSVFNGHVYLKKSHFKHAPKELLED